MSADQVTGVPAAAITAAARCLTGMRPAAAPYTDEPTAEEITWAGLILEAAEPHLAAARFAVDKLDLQPGDRIIIRVAHEIDLATIDKIRGQVRHALDMDIPVLVLDSSIESIARMRGAQDDELAAARTRIAELETSVARLVAQLDDTASDASDRSAEADAADQVAEARAARITQLEQLVDSMLAAYTKTGDGWRARVSGTIYARWRTTRAGQQ